MELVVLYIGLAVIGYFVGDRLKKSGKSLSFTGKIQTICIVILVFMMGARIGADEEVIASMGTIGITSFVITIFALAGSVAMTFLARKFLKIDNRGEKTND